MILLSRWWWAVSEHNYQLSAKPETKHCRVHLKPKTWAHFSYPHLLQVLTQSEEDESLNHTHEMPLEEINMTPSR